MGHKKVEKVKWNWVSSVFPSTPRGLNAFPFSQAGFEKLELKVELPRFIFVWNLILLNFERTHKKPYQAFWMKLLWTHDILECRQGHISVCLGGSQGDALPSTIPVRASRQDSHSRHSLDLPFLFLSVSLSILRFSHQPLQQIPTGRQCEHRYLSDWSKP